MTTDQKLITAGVSLIVGIIVLMIVNPFTMISAGERGIVLEWGAVKGGILTEGIHWVTPIVQHVKVLNVQIQKEQVAVQSASKDLQTVTSQVALNYHLQEDKVDQLWQKIGSDYKTKVIDPAIQEAFKASTAKFTAEELITKREEVKADAKSALVERLAKDYVNVDELSITDFDFSAQFNASIEKKVTANQDALAAENKLKQIQFEAEQTIATAKAQAESIRIQAQAINSQGGADYVSLQAIKAWDGKLPIQMIPNSTVPFINLTK
jgi:regulator of protease activity HflC (stomatin/prohibitin superfamily)